MGRDKARLRIAGRTMLARIRLIAAEALALRVRVIRKDCVRRCGPLGGIVTALRTSKAQAVLFLACDMPLVSPGLLQRMVRASHKGERATFAVQNGLVGFPFLLPVKSLPRVEEQMTTKEFSLSALAKRLAAHRVVIAARSRELFNVNTPADAARVQTWLGEATQR